MGWFSRRVPEQDRTFAILGSLLDADFTTYPLGEGLAERQLVERIADDLGVRFPDQYLAHVTGKLPGAIVLASEQVWPRPQALDVGPFWTFLYGVHSFTPLTTSEEWMRLDLVGRRFQSDTGLQAAPILKVMGDANVFCTDSAARISVFDHEMNTLEPVELDFWALFEREVAELVKRKNRLVREREREE